MAAHALYIDTSSNTLLSGIGASAGPVNANTLPLYFGDTLALQIYLLAPLQNPPPSDFAYQVIETDGLALFLYIDAGTVGGTIYTQQINWTIANDGEFDYFSGNLSLNTVALEALMGTATSATAWIKIGYIQNGLQTTVFSQQIQITVGLPLVNLTVPPGQTPLSAEVAQQTYLSLQPVNGRALMLSSPLGKIIELVVVDNPDGSASLKENNLN